LTRYQQLNLAAALEKLREIIRESEKPEKIELSAEKKESIRKSKERAARERLIEKRMRSHTKSDRQAPIVD
jgi:peptidyl-tRNA hydrolase ICT1